MSVKMYVRPVRPLKFLRNEGWGENMVLSTLLNAVKLLKQISKIFMVINNL